MTALLRISLIALTMLAFAAPARAHPHVWVTMHTELVYAPDGSITGVRHHWAFDDMFSAFATQGMEAKEKGKFTREELAPLAKVNVESLKEYDYFTYATADGKKAELTEPAPDYWLDFHSHAEFHVAVQDANQGQGAQGRGLRPDHFRRLRMGQERAGASRRRAALQGRRGNAARDDLCRRQGAERHSRRTAEHDDGHWFAVRQQDFGALSLNHRR
jgi:hypothetical protein